MAGGLRAWSQTRCGRAHTAPTLQVTCILVAALRRRQDDGGGGGGVAGGQARQPGARLCCVQHCGTGLYSSLFFFFTCSSTKHGTWFQGSAAACNSDARAARVRRVQHRGSAHIASAAFLPLMHVVHLVRNVQGTTHSREHCSVAWMSSESRVYFPLGLIFQGAFGRMWTTWWSSWRGRQSSGPPCQQTLSQK